MKASDAVSTTNHPMNPPIGYAAAAARHSKNGVFTDPVAQYVGTAMQTPDGISCQNLPNNKRVMRVNIQVMRVNR